MDSCEITKVLMIADSRECLFFRERLHRTTIKLKIRATATYFGVKADSYLEFRLGL